MSQVRIYVIYVKFWLKFLENLSKNLLPVRTDVGNQDSICYK